MHDGFATYRDIEWICYRLLKEKRGFAERLSKRFPLIIVDECQDCSWIQLEILGLIKQAGSTLHFIGDLNQSIYEFKKVEPQKIDEFVTTHEFMVEELSDNFRSCQSIVDLCCKLVGGV
ncbi:MAG: UvrD-helicase domain-containing protein [Deltaproteobacteria bacterium]|nr:UvrD-helicase domain-containing protein [Deltaproteobacteria bacterium]